ncbi:glycine cleavage system aminomethyltransferase GcvT [Prolixibacter denitrificans]|uniref:Aminomethyltransferase n=1 Tax=Prolixibacter denitrificans TaxID=1541063 RepID=A0A2P8CG21_9BACT|nr:glycine cleavage system aminomethyltransferase GcvT [Prolixibacter denitrificans]PSK83918.1 aminomethyltransferase [Prolixibacter denitrificans]GET23459.1 aminomethyltransferase [Prolixibacter denitrificans]
MKRTAFFDIHNSNGAKIVEFAGFEMPIEYSGIKDEHMTVRNGVGVFDVSHMGEFWVTGPQALAFIQKVTSNDASKLAPGQAQYSCLPNGKGGIVDDLIVYCFEPEKYLLVVNAANIEKDWQWLVSQNTEEAEMLNASDEISQLAIQGPKATGILQKLTKVDLSSIKFYTFTVGEFAGVSDVIISATGYTGAGGFELYFNNKDAEAIWSAIFEAGKEEGIKPIGLGARDTLRLEMGYCLYGNDIDDTTSPIEAGLGWITKFTDEKNFIDKDVLTRQKEEGVTRRLRAFEMIDRGIPRHGYEIVNEDDEVIGEVTSGSMSPVRGIGIGMGYVKTGYTKLGTEIYIRVRNKKLKAKVVKLPFI